MRMTMSVTYLLSTGKDLKVEQLRLCTSLFGKSSHITRHGITMALFKEKEDALTRRPNCKSLVPCNVLQVSGLRLDVTVCEIMETLLAHGVILCRAMVWTYTMRNRSAGGKELRYLVVLGQVERGNVNLNNHYIFKPISTRSNDIRYDIRIEVGELPAQPELRRLHQGTPALPVTTPHTASTPGNTLVSRKPVNIIPQN